MIPNAHLGDEAELYALGVLDGEERATVDRHIAQCLSCRRRVGEAEETVLAMERRYVPYPVMPAVARLPFARRGIPAWWLGPAVAAAFTLGILLFRPHPQDNAPLLAMVNSHFNHSQFAGAAAPPAKVLYARDFSWYYIVVAGSHAFDVYGLEGATATLLGSAHPRGGVSVLFVSARARYNRIELRDRGRFVETASIR